jgi:hypothetical protein
LPGLKFGTAKVSLLGRDLIFSRFQLRMTPTEFERPAVSEVHVVGADGEEVVVGG